MKKKIWDATQMSAAPQGGEPAGSTRAALPFGTLMIAASVSSWAQSAVEGEVVLPEVPVVGTRDIQGKDQLQTRQTNIGKGTQDIRDIPQSMNVITEKLIDDVKLNTLREALHYSAGITFAAAENGTDQDIRLRGFPVASTGDLLLDGMRDPSQYDRDTFNYERIEVLRGSASMIFGRGSTGGVINQVTKKPLLADQYDVVGTLGTDAYARSTIDLNTRLGEESAFRLNAMATKSDNRGAKIGKFGFAPTISFGIGSADEFTVGLFYLNVDNVPLAGIRYLPNGTTRNGVGQSAIADLRAGNFYGAQSDYSNGQAAYGNAAYIHRFDDGGELRSQVRSGRFDRSLWTTAAGFCAVAPNAAGACPAGTPAVTSATLNDNTFVTRSGLAPRKDQYRTTYFQSDYQNSFVFGGKHDILTGIDLAHESADRFGAFGLVGTNFNKGPTLVGTPDDGTTLSVSPTFRPTNDYSARSFGVYFQDLWQIAKYVKLLGGIRYDNFKGDFQQRTYANANATVPSAINTANISDSLFSYRGGMLFQPTNTQSYHFSYSTSFNTSADTYQYVTQQTANTPPEKSRNIELGAKLDWLDGRLSTRGALFRTEKYNERTTDSDFAANSFLLSGKRHAQGLELDIVGKITRDLEVYISYAYIPEAKIDQVGSTQAAVIGRRVGLTPRHSGATWLSYQVTRELRVAGGVRGASENRPLQGVTGAASTTAYVPGYIAGDAMVEYKFSPDLYTQLNVINVANTLYGDQLYPAFVIAGPQRSVQLTVGARF